jgi:predicted DsbA family dithiol-disulfide isomerase
MKLELWLDVVCPWCFLGKRRLEEALRSFDHRDEAGIDFRFDDAQPGNSFNAHRLIQLAKRHGVADAVAERLMRGYFSEGLALADAEALADAAAEASLDAAHARAALAGDELVSEVRADEHKGAALGIQGVPFLVLDDQYGVSGAQPAAGFLQALQTAWDQRAAAA